MEKDNDVNSVCTEELGDDNGNPEILFPPFFMQLPTEVQIKILDSVSGVDIAKASCVSSEFRNLASNDDLWKQKFLTQFGNYYGSGNENSFKKRFVKAWEDRKSNIMKRNRFNPFGGDFGEDDEHEWLNIVRLCLPRGVVPRHMNGMQLSNCNQDSNRGDL